MQIVGIVNSKGGVSKSTTARNLGAELSARHRVLLIDADQQASLTAMCGIKDIAHGLADVIGSNVAGWLPTSQAIQPVSNNLSIIPSGINLASSEIGLVTRLGRENVLKKSLAGLNDFDVCLIDSPPSLGLLMTNVLVACNGLIVPCKPEITDLRALAQFITTVETVKQELNPSLQLIGVLITQYSAQLTHHNEAIELIEGAKHKMFKTRIGRTIRMADAAINGLSISEYEPSNPRAGEYKALAKEIETWLRKQV